MIKENTDLNYLLLLLLIIITRRRRIAAAAAATTTEIRYFLIWIAEGEQSIEDLTFIITDRC